ncbi:3-oxoacyl-ACP reductase FabG [Nocardia sp. BSTN01]|uniref:3-oxoacyl-ACP reductase family protein n=1 Tax=Nocardia sp. BSTN01 TaxID=2783665 RepID=UPI00188E7DC6|nr:3-oxoacyl-ACP reductase family protein [Nocardia sp. BSTN01]MBF5002329.1 3-oxoacyl-ACP reductase FabG [Nocardia sp. BSTN01]
MTLEGTAALVTGASRGIGRAIALELAAQGAAVAVNYRANKDDADKVVALIEERGGKAIALAADVSDLAETEGLVAAALAELGRLDILVNNAGIAVNGLLWDVDPSEWWRVIQVNLGSAYHGIRCVAEHFMAQQAGSIVNISSVVGSRGWIGTTNYAASKGALDALTRTSAIELARFGIRVNAVAPGYAPTDLVNELLDKSAAKLVKQVPQRRLAEVQDIADAVVFLASNRSRHITGQVLAVDGGFSSQIGLGRP